MLSSTLTRTYPPTHRLTHGYGYTFVDDHILESLYTWGLGESCSPSNAAATTAAAAGGSTTPRLPLLWGWTAAALDRLQRLLSLELGLACLYRRQLLGEASREQATAWTHKGPWAGSLPPLAVLLFPMLPAAFGQQPALARGEETKQQQQQQPQAGSQLGGATGGGEQEEVEQQRPLGPLPKGQRPARHPVARSLQASEVAACAPLQRNDSQSSLGTLLELVGEEGSEGEGEGEGRPLLLQAYVAAVPAEQRGQATATGQPAETASQQASQPAGPQPSPSKQQGGQRGQAPPPPPLPPSLPNELEELAGVAGSPPSQVQALLEGGPGAAAMDKDPTDAATRAAEASEWALLDAPMVWDPNPPLERRRESEEEEGGGSEGEDVSDSGSQRSRDLGEDEADARSGMSLDDVASQLGGGSPAAARGRQAVGTQPAGPGTRRRVAAEAAAAVGHESEQQLEVEQRPVQVRQQQAQQLPAAPAEPSLASQPEERSPDVATELASQVGELASASMLPEEEEEEEGGGETSGAGGQGSGSAPLLATQASQHEGVLAPGISAAERLRRRLIEVEKRAEREERRAARREMIEERKAGARAAEAVRQVRLREARRRARAARAEERRLRASLGRWEAQGERTREARQEAATTALLSLLWRLLGEW